MPLPSDQTSAFKDVSPLDATSEAGDETPKTPDWLSLTEDRRSQLQALFSRHPVELPDEVPDFEGVIPADFKSPDYDVRSPKAHALAQKLWPEFAAYMWARRVLGLGTMDKKLLRIYPIGSGKPGVSLIMASAEAILQTTDKIGVGEVDHESMLTFASARLTQLYSSEEMSAIFLLAFAYPTSDLRRIIYAEVRRQMH